MNGISLSVITKIWGFLCVMIAVSLGKNVILSCMLTIIACLYLAVQGKLKIIFNYGVFYMILGALAERSEERRVGKECRSRWSPYH